MTDTLSHSQAAEDFIRSVDLPFISISFDGMFSASTYWPKGRIGTDKFCHGRAEMLDDAIAKMREKIVLAEAESGTLKTAADCKAAVLDLIREHDAAPASFRDAVDGLRVA